MYRVPTNSGIMENLEKHKKGFMHGKIFELGKILNNHGKIIKFGAIN